MTDFADTYETARRLSLSGELIGARVRVGVCDPDANAGYLFAVLNHRGEALALANDAYQAARWFMAAENQEEWEEWVDDTGPTIHLPSDVVLLERADMWRRAIEMGSATSRDIDETRVARRRFLVTLALRTE